MPPRPKAKTDKIEKKPQAPKTSKGKPAKTSAELRLNKAIADSGLCSRRQADKLIVDGLVSVNGKTITSLGTQVSPKTDKILVEGKSLPSVRPIYLLLHKPKDYLATRHDTHDRKTIYDLLPEKFHSVDSAGRLDRDSTGLIVLSNDGDFIHRLTHPSFHCIKTYRVTTSKPLTEDAARKLIDGILLKPENKLAKIEDLGALPIDRAVPNEWPYEVSLLTGYNRQIRRSFEAVGFPITKLKRTAFGFLRLGQLKPGEFRPLTPIEIDRLLKLRQDKKAPKKPTSKPAKPNDTKPVKASSKTSRPAAKKHPK